LKTERGKFLAELRPAVALFCKIEGIDYDCGRGLMAGQPVARYANETALDYYDRALAFETRPEWLQGKAEVLHILGQRAAPTRAL
jgi:hypothetical protein